MVRAIVSLFLSLWIVHQAQSAPKRLHLEQSPDKEISYKAIDCRLEGIAKGVLILVPGCNGDGRNFLSEKRWVEFATRNRLALVGVSFKSPTDLLKDRKGYYDVSRGSGRALLSLLEKAGLTGRPLLMFGFSGGAHCVSSFVEEYPSDDNCFQGLPSSDECKPTVGDTDECPNGDLSADECRSFTAEDDICLPESKGSDRCGPTIIPSDECFGTEDSCNSGNQDTLE